jgi:DNA-directed RNA polymerase subunit RPC12/RpoP
MKNKLTVYCCIDKACGWEERTHKIRDGIKCPECNGPVMVGVDWDDAAKTRKQKRPDI